MITAAQLPNKAAEPGRNGREHVKEDFLITTNIRRWLLLRILLRKWMA